MSLDQLGETGLPGAQGLPYLTPEEIGALREEPALLPFKMDEALLEGIVQSIYELRGWEKMREDAEPKNRRRNLRECARLATAGKDRAAMRNLTSKNQFAVRSLQSKHRDMSLSQAMDEVLHNLPIRGRGRARSNGRHAVAVSLAHLLQTRGHRVSSTAESAFVNLLGVVFSFALAKPVDALHNAAEQALRVRADFSQAILEIPPRP